MEKDFDGWSKLKKKIHGTRGSFYVHKRQIWWCSIGINIGSETDGKNINYERPVLVMRVYSKETLLALPITSKPKDDPFHYKISGSFGSAWIELTQARVISSRRLLRKIDILPNRVYLEIRKSFIAWL